MPVKLNSTGGGSVTLTTPSTASDFTATFPAATGNVVTTGSSAVVTPAMLSQPLTSGTAVTASGTSVDFTGIPSWVKRVAVMFSGLSTNGTSGISLQIGDAGGIETTGYACGTSNGASSTSEFPLTGGSGAAAGLIHGGVILTLVGSNTWSISGVVGRSDVAAAFSIGGSKALSDTLTQVRLKGGNGTDTFDAGSINILYE